MGLSYFYHATTKEDYTKILKEGLLPRVGDNSKSLYPEDTKRYAYVIDPLQNNNNLRDGYVEVTDCYYYENLEELLNKLYSDL